MTQDVDIIPLRKPILTLLLISNSDTKKYINNIIKTIDNSPIKNGG